MSGHNLPQESANQADWEYAEYDTANGSWTPQITKSGVLPVHLNGSATLTLPTPSRAGVTLVLVIAKKTSGTLTLAAQDTAYIYAMGYNDGSGASSTADSIGAVGAGEFIQYFSIPIYLNGSRTYRWAMTNHFTE